MVVTKQLFGRNSRLLIALTDTEAVYRKELEGNHRKPIVAHLI